MAHPLVTTDGLAGNLENKVLYDSFWAVCGSNTALLVAALQ
jgi:hypothetical protein